MLLYDLPVGMNPRRVRIFLAEKGVTVPMRTVDAAADENRNPPFLALNPLGKAVGLRIPPELTELTRWFAAVSTRPTARA